MADKYWVMKNKGTGPWELIKQSNKFGYLNNPNYVPKSEATPTHNPCGYWRSGPYKVYGKLNWFIDGIKWFGRTVTVGVGKDYATLNNAVQDTINLKTSALYLISSGTYSDIGIINESTLNYHYFKAVDNDVTMSSVGMHSNFSRNIIIEGVTLNYGGHWSGESSTVAFNKCIINGTRLVMNNDCKLIYAYSFIKDFLGTLIYYNLHNTIISKCIFSDSGGYFDNSTDNGYGALDFRWEKIYSESVINGENTSFYVTGTVYDAGEIVSIHRIDLLAFYNSPAGSMVYLSTSNDNINYTTQSFEFAFTFRVLTNTYYTFPTITARYFKFKSAYGASFWGNLRLRTALGDKDTSGYGPQNGEYRIKYRPEEEFIADNRDPSPFKIY